MSQRQNGAAAADRGRPVWANRRQMRYLSQAEILEELGPSQLSRALIILLSTLVFAGIAWASMATIQRTSKATGEVVPRGAIHTVQHLEGGIVQEVLVKEGDFVNAGDPLVRLSPTTSFADLEAALTRRVALSVKAERLRAFADQREPNFEHVPERFSGLVLDQLTILRQRNEARRERRNVLELQLAQEHAEHNVLLSEQAKLRSQRDILSEERNTQMRLLKEGLVSKFVLLNAEKELQLIQGELAEVRQRMVKAEQAINEAEAKLNEFEASSRDEALDDMGGIAAELAEIEEAIVRLQDRVQRLDVVAPVRGIVQELEADAVGRVVTPGVVVGKLVPVDGELIAEAKLSPADVGQIRVGDKARVKVTTFDYARFGAVDGKVEKISATTFKERDGTVYYKVVVRLGARHVGPDPSQNVLLPGMVADIELLGEERTVLRYLLRPVFQSLDTALTEK